MPTEFRTDSNHCSIKIHNSDKGCLDKYLSWNKSKISWSELFVCESIHDPFLAELSLTSKIRVRWEHNCFEFGEHRAHKNAVDNRNWDGDKRIVDVSKFERVL